MLLPTELSEVDERHKDDRNSQKKGHEVIRKVDALYKDLDDREHLREDISHKEVIPRRGISLKCLVEDPHVNAVYLYDHPKLKEDIYYLLVRASKTDGLVDCHMEIIFRTIH